MTKSVSRYVVARPELKEDTLNRHSLRLATLPLLLATLLASCSQPASVNTDPERAERYTAYFNEADSDKNGVLEPGEIGSVIDADFARMDYDKNGSLTIEDVYNPEQGAPEGATQNIDLSHHLPYDANTDGTITPDEHRAYLNANVIGKIDTNSDGQITLVEYRAYAQF